MESHWVYKPNLKTGPCPAVYDQQNTKQTQWYFLEGFCLLVICLVILFFYLADLLLMDYGFQCCVLWHFCKCKYWVFAFALFCVFLLWLFCLVYLFVLYCPNNFFLFISFLFPFLLPDYFLVRKKEHLWVWVTWEMGRLWEDLGGGTMTVTQYMKKYIFSIKINKENRSRISS